MANAAVGGMIGRKVGMMRLYDGSGRVRAVTVIELGPNPVTQVRTPERDGYSAVQLGFEAGRKRLNRPQRGHLSKARVEAPLAVLREFRLRDGEAPVPGQAVTVDRFEAGTFVNVTGTSKGRGFAGGVKRWHFHGGPKTHGQSDRHRAPGSVGAGTTPGKVWKGQHMAGHMGARTSTVVNVLVVLADAGRNLLFVEGSVPGARSAVVTVTPGRRPPLKNYTPPTLHVGVDVDEDAAADGKAEDEVAGEVVETGDEREDAEGEAQA